MNNEDFDHTNSQMLRKKAEKILKKKKGIEPDPHKSDENKLLHELQVHQIELEMQNEELQLAYDVAEKALKKYTLLYDFAPMGYLTIGSDGAIRELNIAASEMIGERRSRLVEANLKQFIVDESMPVFNTFLTKVFADDLKQTCVVSIGNNNDQSIRIFMEGVFIPENNSCILSFLDISTLKSKPALRPVS